MTTATHTRRGTPIAFSGQLTLPVARYAQEYRQPPPAGHAFWAIRCRDGTLHGPYETQADAEYAWTSIGVTRAEIFPVAQGTAEHRELLLRTEQARAEEGRRLESAAQQQRRAAEEDAAQRRREAEEAKLRSAADSEHLRLTHLWQSVALDGLRLLPDGLSVDLDQADAQVENRLQTVLAGAVEQFRTSAAEYDQLARLRVMRQEAVQALALSREAAAAARAKADDFGGGVSVTALTTAEAAVSAAQQQTGAQERLVGRLDARLAMAEAAARDELRRRLQDAMQALWQEAMDAKAAVLQELRQQVSQQLPALAQGHLLVLQCRPAAVGGRLMSLVQDALAG